MSDLKAKAQALIDKLEFIHQNEGYQTVWTVSQLHIGPYFGPTYTRELEELKKAIADEA